jgi:hypothetical protein
MKRIASHARLASAALMAGTLLVAASAGAKVKNESCPDGQLAMGLDGQGNLICASADSCPCWDYDSALSVVEEYIHADPQQLPINAAEAGCEFGPTGGRYLGSSNPDGDLYGELWVDRSRSSNFSWCFFRAEGPQGPFVDDDRPRRFPPQETSFDFGSGVHALPIAPHEARACLAVFMTVAEDAGCPAVDHPFFPLMDWEEP